MPSEVGTIVPFKVIQKCGDKEDRWIEVVEDGEPAWKMWAQQYPSPYVEVVEAPGPQLGATMKQLQEERQKQGQGAPPE